MKEKRFSTPRGDICYWRGECRGGPALVFLPGLTADHRLFEKQLSYFGTRYDVLVWDAPGHGASRPFRLDFTLMDKARWLHGILEAEGIRRPVLIGQSMGGYVSQCFLQAYPGEAAGFVSIDSAPIQRQYVTALEILLLRHMYPVYRLYPWEALKKAGAEGCATTEFGRSLMRCFLESYDREEYCRLSAHGMRILADAMAANPPFAIDCPALLICGTEDRAGSARRYNRNWARRTGLPIRWIEGAGHNANTDRPDEVNRLIRDFVAGLV